MSKPEFDVALKYWNNLLEEREFAPNTCWVFRENIFNAKDKANENFRLVFETKINPVTTDDVRLVYNQAKSQEGPIVFATLVGTQDYTLCTLLGDTLTTSDDIFVKEWNMYFFARRLYPAPLFEEVEQQEDWNKAKKQEWDHISELDYVFCLDAFKNPRKKRFWQK